MEEEVIDKKAIAAEKEAKDKSKDIAFLIKNREAIIKAIRNNEESELLNKLDKIVKKYNFSAEEQAYMEDNVDNLLRSIKGEEPQFSDKSLASMKDYEDTINDPLSGEYTFNHRPDLDSDYENYNEEYNTPQPAYPIGNKIKPKDLAKYQSDLEQWQQNKKTHEDYGPWAENAYNERKAWHDKYPNADFSSNYNFVKSVQGSAKNAGLIDNELDTTIKDNEPGEDIKEEAIEEVLDPNSADGQPYDRATILAQLANDELSDEDWQIIANEAQAQGLIELREDGYKILDNEPGEDAKEEVLEEAINNAAEPTAEPVDADFFSAYANKIKQERLGTAEDEPEAELDEEMTMADLEGQTKGGINPRIAGIANARGLEPGTPDYDQFVTDYENERKKGLARYKETGISNKLQRVMDKEGNGRKLNDNDKDRYFKYLYDKNYNLRDGRQLPEGRQMEDYLTESRAKDYAEFNKKNEYKSLIQAGLTHQQAIDRMNGTSETTSAFKQTGYDPEALEPRGVSLDAIYAANPDISKEEIDAALPDIKDKLGAAIKPSAKEEPAEQQTEEAIEQSIPNTNVELVADKPTTEDKAEINAGATPISKNLGSNFAKLIARQGGAEKARVMLKAKQDGLMTDEDIEKGLSDALQNNKEEPQINKRKHFDNALAPLGDSLMQASAQVGNAAKGTVNI